MTTLLVLANARLIDGTGAPPRDPCDEGHDASEAAPAAIRRAFRLGTPMAAASDSAYVFPPFDVAKMECFRELNSGIPPIDLSTAATRNAARAVGRGDAWGTIEPGKVADLLVLEGDPSRDVRVLRDKSRIVATVQDGRFAKDAPTGVAHVL